MGNHQADERGFAGNKLETIKNFAGWSVIAAFFVAIIFVLDYAFL
jgi:hypothetical protein